MSRQAGSPGCPRVLVVEDEQVVAMDLERSLEGLGFEVAGVADTGKSAVRLAGKVRPDLVLMDVRLRGEMDGITAADEIRRRWQIPIVFTTAYTNAETIERAKATGPFGYLVKPFRAKELNATITMALQQHRIAQQVLASRAWLTTILASIGDGVIATDASGRVQFMNRVAEQLTGWKRDDALGLPIEQVYQLADFDRKPVDECQLRKALGTLHSQPKTCFVLNRRDGTQVPIDDGASPIHSESGDLAGAVTVFADASDRLRLENMQVAERERLEERVHSSEHALDETREELRALAASVMTAREEEGRRLARELHDDFSQRLALLEFEAELLRRRASPGEIQSGLERISQRAARLSADLRELSHTLHPAVLEDLGLVAALRGLVEEHREKGGKARLFERGVTSPVTLPVATSAYRIAQEALRNAAKHAPGALVQLRLTQNCDELRLEIEDSGPGFDMTDVRGKGGLGLLSMNERARLVGGSVLVRTQPGKGTRLIARFPLVSGTSASLQ